MGADARAFGVTEGQTHTASPCDADGHSHSYAEPDGVADAASSRQDPDLQDQGGRQMTVLVPPTKVARLLIKGFTIDECPATSDGAVMCKSKRGRMTSVAVGQKKAQWSRGKGLTLGVCRAP